MDNYELPAECQAAPSMETWFKQGQENTCVECVMPVATRWYIDALNEDGEATAAENLSKYALGEGRDALQLCQELDRIKSSSGISPGLATYLKELDCTVQVNAVDLV